MILVSEEKVNHTSENHGKALSSQRYSGKQQFLGKCRRCDKPGHIGKEREVSRNHVAGNVENKGIWRFVAMQSKKSNPKEEAKREIWIGQRENDNESSTP